MFTEGFIEAIEFNLLAIPDNIDEEILFEEQYVWYIIISGHEVSSYNGVYLRFEDWNGFAHFAKADRSAHLYYKNDSGRGYWRLDNRDQDGSEEEFYNGG